MSANILYLVSGKTTSSVTVGQWLLVFFLLVVFIVSFFGGIFVCCVIVSRRLMRKKIWTYFLILTIADSCTAIVVIPTYIAALFHDDWMTNRGMCVLNVFSETVFSIWSVYAMTAVSMYKFIMVSNPFRSLDDEKSGQRFTLFLIITTVVSLGLTVPPLVGYSGYQHTPGEPWCDFGGQIERINNSTLSHTDQDQVMLTLLGMFGYCIPLLTMMASSIATYVSTRRQHQRRQAMFDLHPPNGYIQQMKLVKILLMLVGTFVALWTPLFVYIILHILLRKVYSYQKLFGHVARILTLLQGCVNPTLYCFQHDVFRVQAVQFIDKQDTFKLTKLKRALTVMKSLSVEEEMLRDGTEKRIATIMYDSTRRISTV